MSDGLTTIPPRETARDREQKGWRATLSQSLQELWKDKVATVGFALTLSFLLVALIGPAFIGPDATIVSPANRLRAPLEGAGVFGTDALGRDVLSRLVLGANSTIIVCTTVVFLAAFTGTLVGVISGYVGGRLDTVVSRWVEIQGSFPALLLALLVLAVVQPGLLTLIIVLSIERWPYFVKVARGQALSIRHAQYIEGAELIGAGRARVVLRHVLPGTLPPVLTLAVLEFAHVIIAEATLTYLGYGIQPPAVSWGLMISEGQPYIFDSWWLVVFPGLALLTTVAGLNLMGSWIQDSLNPQQRSKRFTLRPATSALTKQTKKA